MRILNNIVAAILLLIANIIEIYFVWLVVKRSYVSNNYLFLVHFIASIIVVIALLISRLKYVKDDAFEKHQTSDYILDIEEEESDSEIVRHPILLPAFTISFFLPIFGVFVTTILSILMKPIEGQDSDVFQEYIDYIRYNPSNRPRFSRIDINTEIFNNLEIEPVTDLLKTSERTVIWGSVENLSKRSDQVAVSLIRQTMGKNDMDVKYLSSLSLDKIEASYAKKIEKLKEKIAISNEEVDYMEILELIDKFYSCKILPEELASKLVQDSLMLIDASIKLFPFNNEVLGYRGRFLKYSDNWDGAFDIFDKLFTNNNLPQKFYLDAAEIYAYHGNMNVAEKLMNIFTQNPENQKYLDEISREVELDDLRALWVENEVLHA